MPRNVGPPRIDSNARVLEDLSKQNPNLSSSHVLVTKMISPDFCILRYRSQYHAMYENSKFSNYLKILGLLVILERRDVKALLTTHSPVHGSAGEDWTDSTWIKLVSGFTEPNCTSSGNIRKRLPIPRRSRFKEPDRRGAPAR
ncbi:hypothetical protein ALC57_12412 [Trachymyrmex cornetzi]|uniref:Uncharacterized protein n=1 Tax=Trachymyrmex cornetzi TaxID=471704 RepID=A0A195DR67_9HYME|nr:hypothetical protein ALC57_12412 [Trachymyrmex cornetzi]